MASPSAAWRRALASRRAVAFGESNARDAFGIHASVGAAAGETTTSGSAPSTSFCDASCLSARAFSTRGVASASPPSRSPALAEKFSKALVDDIYRSSFRNQTGVSLKYMMDFGAQPIHRQLMVSAQFLHKELPVRLAHRVAELENLPLGLSSKEQVRAVRDWYVESYDELKSFPKIENMEDEARFTKMIEGVMNKHANVVPMIARGVLELKMELAGRGGADAAMGGGSRSSLERTLGADLPEISQFLDGFYMSRIGIRMLIGQHVALHEENPRADHIGLICTKMSPRDVVRDAIDDARSICMRQYGDAPEVEVFGGENFAFAYVPGHLHQMLFELVKNSLRAVSEKYAESLDNPPPIRVVIAEGAEDVTIKISDEGGGIRRSGLRRIWTYLYTTADSPLLDMDGDAASAGGPVVLAGYGYGLPLSRLYARYFGGDLQVISMDGYGTDAYLHLNRLGNVQEPLP